MFYPLKFEPLYKQMIWGGRNLEKLGKKLPEGTIGESWEIAAHPDGMSIIANGPFQGKSLEDVMKKHPKELMGYELSDKDVKKFPLLIKLIDANDKLSVQVHPDDDYALIHEDGEYGKTECWYVVDAKANAQLVYDLKDHVTKEDLQKAIKNDQMNDCLQYVTVKPGDFLYIPAGLIHAIGEGIVICEVQQNSNTTYRVYDYDRVKDGKKRELHVDKALDVIDFSHNHHPIVKKGLKIRQKQVVKTILAATPYFCVELWENTDTWTFETKKQRFYTLTILEGSGSVDDVLFYKGESLLIPATLDKCTIKGDFKAIVSYVPNIEKNVMQPLSDAGYSAQEIKGNVL